MKVRRHSFGAWDWEPHPQLPSKQHVHGPDNVTDGDVAVTEGDPPASAAILRSMPDQRKDLLVYIARRAARIVLYQISEPQQVYVMTTSIVAIAIPSQSRLASGTACLSLLQSTASEWKSLNLNCSNWRRWRTRSSSRTEKEARHPTPAGVVVPPPASSTLQGLWCNSLLA